MRNFSFGDQVFQSDFFDTFSYKIKRRSLFSKSSFTESLFYFFCFFCAIFLPVFHISGGLENIVGKKLGTAVLADRQLLFFTVKVVLLRLSNTTFLLSN